MDQRVLLATVAALALLAAPAQGQADLFEAGAHFAGVADRDPRWHGGVQVALALDHRFDFYTGVTVFGTGTTQTLLAVRAWPLGRGEQRFAGWYLGAGMLADGAVQGVFLTGVQARTGRLQPFLEAQLLSPADFDARLGFAIRVR